MPVIPIGKTLARVTREDVIHRWFVPSLGIKIDAVPGKQNIFQVTPLKVGVFYGIMYRAMWCKSLIHTYCSRSNSTGRFSEMRNLNGLLCGTAWAKAVSPS